MGLCGSKSQQNIQTPTQRRRLSVGHVDNQGDSTTAEGSDEERGLLKALNEATLMSMLNDDKHGTGRKFSIGSKTDMQKISFANKTIQEEGSTSTKIDPAAMGYGYTCRKGLKPESPNQDSWMVLTAGSFSIYGVFDGHGQKGHDVSNYVKDTLPKLMLRDERFRTDQMKPMIFDAFKKTQSLVMAADRMQKLSAQMSGTTCTICIHDHEQNKITVGHVADSTCVLGVWSDSSKTKLGALVLTRDHKPNLKDERARIEKAGGRVVFDGYANHRVYAKNGRYPGLNMSRCLGDLLGHAEAGCSAEPEVYEKKLDLSDYLLLLCSDGVWEFINPEEAVRIVSGIDNGELRPPAKAMSSAEMLAKESWDRWIREEGGAVVDDITVVLVYPGYADKHKPSHE